MVLLLRAAGVTASRGLLESYYRGDASCLKETLHVASLRHLHSISHPRHDPLEGQSSSGRERANATDVPWR